MGGRVETIEESDPLLLPFLSAELEAEVEQSLTCLLAEHAEPIVRAVIGNKLRLSRPGADDAGAGDDAEDVRGEALVRLLGRLRDLRADPAAKPIGNFQGYVAVVTYNVCYAYLRKKYPQRRLLKNRVRYLLNNWADFAIWEGDEQEWLCGLAVWRHGPRTTANHEQLQQLCADPQQLAVAGAAPGSAQQTHLLNLCGAIFSRLGCPVELDALVNILAELQGIKDQPTSATQREEEDDGEHAPLPDLRADVATEVEQRLYLRRLWAEICALPQRQRAALLLNLTTAQDSVISLLPLIGVATIRQIAEALATPAEQFAQLWNELPLDDTAIAARLGLTRQQVINLRKAARERLSRHMKRHGHVK